METPEVHRARVCELHASASRQVEQLVTVERSLDDAQQILSSRRGDAHDSLIELEETVASARRELADLTAALRSDRTELVRLAGKAEPRRSRRS